MTVKELIEKLKQYPDETKVEFSYWDNECGSWKEFLNMKMNHLEASKVLDFEIFY